MVIVLFWSATGADSADSQGFWAASKIPISGLGKKSV
jgi:hypothetical protein